MKTLDQLQAARERENRATDFEGFYAQDINESYQLVKDAGGVPYSFPISGDALARAKHYEMQA